MSRFVMLLGFGNSLLFFLPIYADCTRWLAEIGGGERLAGVPGPGHGDLFQTSLTRRDLPWLVVFSLRPETVHPSAVHLESDIAMPSADKSSTSKVLHVFEGHPSFYCSNCSAVIASISHFTSPDYT